MAQHAGWHGSDGTSPRTGDHHADPAVVEAVEHVRDRFGAHGLRDMIDLARHELEVAEAALAELARAVRTGDGG